MKQIISILITIILIISMGVSAYAAGGFRQTEYDKLTTYAAKKAYLDGVSAYYDKNGSWGELPADEITAFNEARWALADSNTSTTSYKPTYGTNVPTDAAEIIARIEKTYGVPIRLGYQGDGKYEQGAPMLKHLENIESALSYLGSAFTKKVAKTYTDFHIRLDPATDATAYVPNYGLPQASGTFYPNNGYILVRGNETNIVKAVSIVHELGHALDYAVRTDDYPEPFKSEKYRWGEFGATNVASKQPDRFVNQYAETKTSEDYAECFRVAVMGGEKNPIAYGSNTALYKKMKVIYNDLMEFAGADSRATQRIAGYLGI